MYDVVEKAHFIRIPNAPKNRGFEHFPGVDYNIGQRANCQDFNVNDFIAAVKIDHQKIFPIQLAPRSSDNLHGLFCQPTVLNSAEK
jgi:hypothetical protein